jgi:hypothetical protein
MGDIFRQNVQYFWHAKYQRVKLAAFLAGLLMPCLDKVVSGIPNAIPEPYSAARATANVDARLLASETQILSARRRSVLMLARAADE